MTPAHVLLGGSYTVMMLMLLLHPDHTMDQTWSLHAEIHLRQAMNWAIGLCVTGLALTIWGLRPREQWVWWTLLINGIGLFAGYSAPPLLLAQEPFSLVDLWGLSGLAGLNMLGLILARCRQWPLSRSTAHAPGS